MTQTQTGETKARGSPRPVLSPRPSPLADFSLSRDVDAFHAIFHDPSVVPFVTQHGHEPRDLGEFFDDPGNMGFLYNGAAFLAHRLEPGVYEVHSAALPHVRGRYAIEAAKLAIRFMFLATPALELLTRVVDGNKAALGLTNLMGFAHEFDRADAWLTAEGPRSVAFYALRYPEWIKRQDWLQQSGRWFHDLLGDTATHGDDPGHDRYVGAAVEMMMAGQPDKAVGLYNRWARFAGYEPVFIAARDPLTINIVSHLVTLDGSNIEVMPCQ